MKHTMLFAWIMLTALDGTPVWVESSAITIMRPSLAQCQYGNGAAIRIGGKGLCVKETPSQIRELMGQHK